MAITRTPIVDDDGSGETGTTIDNLWKQELYDQIDGVVSGVEAPIAGGGVITLPVNTTVVRVSPATPIVISGVTALGGAKSGQQVLLHNAGPSTVRIAQEDVGAAAADRVIYLASTRGQILGVGGCVRLVYDATWFRWRMFLVTPGRPIPVTYSSADFTASAGNWTVDAGDAIANEYVQEGAVLSWWFRIGTSSVSTAGAGLQLKVPGGFSIEAAVSVSITAVIRIVDAGAPNAFGLCLTGYPSATQCSCYSNAAGGGFGVATNTTEVQGMVRIPIQ